MRSHPDVWVLTVLLLLLAGCEGQATTAAAVGTLERDRVDLVADGGEPIIELRVREGDRVAQGDLLLVQDDRLARAALARVQARIRSAVAARDEAVHGPRPEEIEQVRAREDAAASVLAVAELELQRVMDLRGREFSTQNEVDLARGRVDQARAGRLELQRLLAELELGTREEVVRRLASELDAAETDLIGAELALARTRLLAPVAGLVEAMPMEVGERPLPGATVASLLDSARLYARVHLPATLRQRLAPGAPARVRLQAPVQQGQASHPARVRWIASEAAFTPFYAQTQQDASRLSYLAEIDLDAGLDLPVGVPVEVSFPGLEGGAQ